MKAHLMYRDRDFDLQQALPANEAALRQDLGLDIVFGAMAEGDELLLQAARQAVLTGSVNDLDTILYRQAILRDCLQYHGVARKLYEIAEEAIESKRQHWYGIFGHYPGGILHSAVEMLEMLVGFLGKLRRVADDHAGRFNSEGFRALFATFKAELDDEYLGTVKGHLRELRFPGGMLASARLGQGNQGTGYVLRRHSGRREGWLRRLLPRRAPGFTFHIDPRDEGGARALSDLQDRSLNEAANLVAQSADHVLDFFVLLRMELAFYLGCVNLHRRLEGKGVATCFPVPAPAGAGRCSCAGLRDVALSLKLDGVVVGNDLAADGKKLVLITGANQGGKSTFLRSFGQAQLMMQCGMFVAADAFHADLCPALFTHYKREEDTAMASGKFDEELRRMSEIVDALVPDALVLFNESFAATNEREGSEVARQIVGSLLAGRVRLFYVTHLYDFARGFGVEISDETLFLRAERAADGRRTFKLLPGEPLQTSFGVDVYAGIFDIPSEKLEPG